MVQAAAQKVVDDALEGSMALARTKKEDVVSGKLPQAAIRHIDSRYGAAALAGADTDAEHIILITIWIKDNFDHMNDPEKWVAWYKYLDPLKRGSFRTYNNPIETDGDNAGKPQAWDDKVRAQMQALRTFSGTVRGYSGVQRAATQAATLEEPRDAGGPVVRNARGERMAESVEQQIDRIDQLIKAQTSVLQEKDKSYDLRIYSIIVGISVSKDLGGEVQETQTEIRGIDGVTTVRTLGVLRPSGQTLIGQFEIKFEILGAQSRVQYRDKTLVPGLMRIKGLNILRVDPMHRTNKRGTIRTVRETMENAINEAGFGGMAGATSAIRTKNTRTMPTPRGTLEDVMADWCDGGVMAYDAPMDTTNMRYHVMMPVEELLPHISREFRAPKDAFDGMYQNFIKNGATAPVYIAIGKNRRIKVSGNEDLIWYAKRSGLQELPVFLSYQSQV
jgi:hypothetical protein